MPSFIGTHKSQDTLGKAGTAFKESSGLKDTEIGSLASINLRKTHLSKEIELVWEAGEVIRLHGRHSFDLNQTTFP